MPKNTVKRVQRSIEKEVQDRVLQQKSTPSFLAYKKDKAYSKKELEDIEVRRRLRYNDILTCARNNDMTAIIMFPTADQFEIPTAKVSLSLQVQVELLDIYHYLESRKEDLAFALSPATFGPALGIKLSRSTFYKMLRREDDVRIHQHYRKARPVLYQQ
jgi:hypothetical protein